MLRLDDLYKIGRLGKPHGVKGELLFQFSDDVFDTTDADFLFVVIDGLPVPFQIEEYRFRSDDLAIIKFDGISTGEAARELTGCDVMFLRSESDKGEGQLSWAAIMDFNVIDESTGKTIGLLRSVDDSTENLLFSVETKAGKEVLVPAPEELIKDIDTTEKTITMAIPDGLLDL